MSALQHETYPPAYLDIAEGLAALDLERQAAWRAIVEARAARRAARRAAMPPGALGRVHGKKRKRRR